MRVHKYNAKATVVDGIKFPSRREANRYGELKLLERAGEIAQLEMQIRFPLKIDGFLVATYVLDFRYYDNVKNEIIHEECKGFKTDVYQIKKKLMRAIYGIELMET